MSFVLSQSSSLLALYLQINVPYGATLIVDEIFIGLSDSACDTPANAFASNSASPSSWAVSMVIYALIAVSTIASLL
jgi:hypothetical protein